MQSTQRSAPDTEYVTCGARRGCQQSNESCNDSDTAIRVLHVIPAYYPATFWGGPIFSVYSLNNAIARLPGVSLRVLTTDAAGPRVNDRINESHVYLNQDVEITRRIAGAGISIEMLRRLPKLIQWADVVHLTATYSFPTIPTLFACRIFGKPLIWSTRGAILDASAWAGTRRRLLKRVWDSVCNAIIRRGCVVAHTTSEDERRVVKKRIPKAVSAVVPNGVELPDLPPSRDWLPCGQLRMLFMGRIAPKKGLENLLHAMTLLSTDKWMLTIYGTGDPTYVRSVQALAKDLGFVDSRVRFAGHVDAQAKSAAFFNADLCMVPSYTENFCMVVAEALAHGIPVITSHGTPWREVEDRQCGLWVDNDPLALAEAVHRCLQLNLQQMGHRGRTWMREEYDWEEMARRMSGIYRRMMERR